MVVASDEIPIYLGVPLALFLLAGCVTLAIIAYTFVTEYIRHNKETPK